MRIVFSIAGKQTNLPILQNVHIKAEGGGIILSTTNLELAMKTEIRGKVDVPGDFTVPAKLFSDYVGLLPDDRIDTELVGDSLEITCGGTTTKINGMNASEFPLIPSVATKEIIELPADEFKNGLNCVLFSVATTEVRPELSGVYLKISQNEIVMAATDSYRLAEKKISVSLSCAQREVILPSSALREVVRMVSVLAEEEGVGDKLLLGLADNQAVFRFGPSELITRTIEGKYPDYTQIIPTQFQTEAVVGREELIKAVKTASLFSRTGIFDVTLEIGDGVVKAMATDNARGKNSATSSADIKGANNSLVANYRYVLDGLQSMSSEGVTLKVVDGMNPCVIIPNGTLEKGAQTYIVMPIRQ